MTASSTASSSKEKINWVASLPFIGIHLMCLFVFMTGARPVDVGVCVGLYVFRIWGITAGYHRYFSHRAFKAGRGFQFFLALAGCLSVQKGPLWWAAHHRHHHRYSDQAEDLHSPVQKGFWWSHVGWILCDKYNETRYESIKDYARFPELVWLNRLHALPGILLAVALYWLGGFSMLVWGFFVSTTLVFHGTFTINSLSHVFGSRRYKTTDTSRNNWLLALITLGEGWHNNHHYYQNTANQGWFWWEVDLSYYSLRALSWVGLVSKLRTPSEQVKNVYLKYTPEERAALNASPFPPFSSWAPLAERRRAAGQTVRAAEGRVREVLAAAADSLPSPPSPPGLLKP